MTVERTTFVAAAFVVLVATGCPATRYHVDNNAPGTIDVRTPPQRPVPDRRELPGDPGEETLAFNAGLYGGAGPCEAGDTCGEAGIELTLNRGGQDRSHHESDAYVYPISGYGGSLGWSLLHGSSDVALGPMYAEVHAYKLLYGIAAGWSFNPFEPDHGPQVTGWAGPLYLRVRYQLDGGTEMFIGGNIKWPFVWIWSR